MTDNYNNNNNVTLTSLFPVHCKIKPFLKGNAQFIFLCNAQKSSVDVFLMRNIKKHCHKKV